MMEYDKEKVIGVKFDIGQLDITGISTQEFVKHVKIKIDAEEYGQDYTGLFDGSNKMSSKYYDDEKGLLYITFDKPLHPLDLPYFEEEELIYKILEG